MAKKFFKDETMKGISNFIGTEHEELVSDFGKDNFLLGSLCTVVIGAGAWLAYQCGKCAVAAVKYLATD